MATGSDDDSVAVVPESMMQDVDNESASMRRASVESLQRSEAEQQQWVVTFLLVGVQLGLAVASFLTAFDRSAAFKTVVTTVRFENWDILGVTVASLVLALVWLGNAMFVVYESNQQRRSRIEVDYELVYAGIWTHGALVSTAFPMIHAAGLGDSLWSGWEPYALILSVPTLAYLTLIVYAVFSKDNVVPVKAALTYGSLSYVLYAGTAIALAILPFVALVWIALMIVLPLFHKFLMLEQHLDVVTTSTVGVVARAIDALGCGFDRDPITGRKERPGVIRQHPAVLITIFLSVGDLVTDSLYLVLSDFSRAPWMPYLLFAFLVIPLCGYFYFISRLGWPKYGHYLANWMNTMDLPFKKPFRNGFHLFQTYENIFKAIIWAILYPGYLLIRYVLFPLAVVVYYAVQYLVIFPLLLIWALLDLTATVLIGWFVLYPTKLFAFNVVWQLYARRWAGTHNRVKDEAEPLNKHNFHLMVALETFIESVPQFFLQLTNTAIHGFWTPLTYISVAFSALMIANHAYRLIYFRVWHGIPLHRIPVVGSLPELADRPMLPHAISQRLASRSAGARAASPSPTARDMTPV